MACRNLLDYQTEGTRLLRFSRPVPDLPGITRFFYLGLLLLFLSLIPSAGFASPSSNNDENRTDIIPETGEDLSQVADGELFIMEREIQQDLAKDPGNAELHKQLSTVYATLFDRTRNQKGPWSTEWLTRSRDSLEKVLMIHPEDKVAHYNLGVVYKRLGEMERAREELKKAIRLSDPAEDAYLLSACWLQIGSVYEEQGFFEDSKECYVKAREFDYENPDIQEAIHAVEAKRKESGNGGGYSSMGMPSTGNAFSSNPQTAAAMGMDPNAQNQSGIAQALPALGQALMQKFGGGDGGSSSGGQ